MRLPGGEDRGAEFASGIETVAAPGHGDYVALPVGSGGFVLARIALAAGRCETIIGSVNGNSYLIAALIVYLSNSSISYWAAKSDPLSPLAIASA